MLESKTLSSKDIVEKAECDEFWMLKFLLPDFGLKRASLGSARGRRRNGQWRLVLLTSNALDVADDATDAANMVV